MSDKKKILLTGASGFIGRNIFPLLSKKYEIWTPGRDELDLRSSTDVQQYIQNNYFDAIIQSANPNPVKNGKCDRQELMFEDSMRIFMNFYNMREYYGKLLYFGSGAEYDKSRNIIKITEDKIADTIPKDTYGFSKFCMNELAAGTANVYNLRIFGCYGPYDHESKFLTHVIRCCMEERDITIRQDCYFDYMHVYDLAGILEYIIDHDMRYHDYNVCSGTVLSLLDIAKRIKRQMGVNNRIVILQSGWNNEYTADNTRLLNEMGGKYSFIDIEEGIRMQIDFERRRYL